jgi:type VI secretion system protein ImpE
MTMNPTELFRAGRLDEAIQALGAALRDHPTDVQRRSFLFELLCFAGAYDRADRQLDVLASEGKDAQMGALLYRGALHGERVRQEMFLTGSLPGAPPPRPVTGTLNGERFSSLTDADPRVGARLEVIAAGQYLWLPLEHVESLQVQPPARLRDLYWATGFVRTSDSFREQELGEVLLPVLTPLAWRHADPLVRLGRVTEWDALPDGTEIPAGQKMLLVDGEEFPILEVRELRVDAPALTPPHEMQNAPA